MIHENILNAYGCPPAHLDGSPHDFNWATYADRQTSYGVCRCGLSELDATMNGGLLP